MSQPPDSILPDIKSHFLKALTSLKSCSPEEVIADIEILPNKERDLLLHSFSGVSECTMIENLNDPRFISDIFIKTVKKFPNRPALIVGNVIWTYFQLKTRAEEIAGILVDTYDITPNQYVMLMIPKSNAAAFTCMLAIILAGACYIPVDYEKCPIERAAYICNDAQCTLAIVGADHVKNTLVEEIQRGESESPYETMVISTADIDAALDINVPEFNYEDVGRLPDDPCYIIYTSGTTGKPKGVIVTQSNIANLVCAERRLLEINEFDRVYQNFSHSFDFSLEELWMGWSNGAALMYLALFYIRASTNEMIIAGPDLPNMLERAHVTVFSCVPTQLSVLDDIKTVRIIVLGGEAAHETVIDRY